MTALDPTVVHADPDGGIRWNLHTGKVLRADPVISVRTDVFWLLAADEGSPGDPQVQVHGRTSVPDPQPGTITRWTFTNTEYLYRVHSYDPDSDCYLLMWPD